jgi:trans-aconitate 2-methyltransferase
MDAPRYDQTIYHADPGRKSDAHEWVTSYLGGKSGLSVLEVGCATGQELAPLLQRFPRNEYVGLDIADANIREAMAAYPGTKWVAADYMGFSGGRFDLIIAQRTFSVFECTDDELAAKLATDLAPNGIAVVTLPDSCLCTTLHFTLKRILSSIRTKLLDSLLLALARKVRPTLDEATLADRLIYVYVVPGRIAGRKLLKAVARNGLAIEESRRVMTCSPVDTYHRLLVMRKL